MTSPRRNMQNLSELFSEKLRVIGGCSVDEFLHNTQTNLRIRYDVGFSNVASPWFYPIKEDTTYDPSELDDQTEGKSEEGPEELEAIESGEEIPEMPLTLSDSFNPIKIIENTFAQYRPGIKLPQWFMYSKGLGVALRVQLDPETFRVYSTPLLNPVLSQFTMKHTCAKIAIGAGVLDFITSSSPSNIAAPLEEENVICIWSSVQQFVEKSLPLPFPEPGFMYDASTAEVEVLKWFRQTLQSANKSRTSSPLRYGYQLLEEDQFYGCLLRIEDRAQEPEQVYNYLVEPAFVDRDQARVAACLQAMSEGVGNFLRRFIPVVVPPARKAPTPNLQRPITQSKTQYANNTVWPQIIAACRDIHPRLMPLFFYQVEDKKKETKGKFGCTLKVMIPLAPLSDSTKLELNKKNTVSRKYHVPIEYTSQTDARIAVLCLAGKKGVVEFVKNSAPTGSAILPAPSLTKQDPPSKKKKGANKDDKHTDTQTNMTLKTNNLHTGVIESAEAAPHTVKRSSTAGPSVATPPKLSIGKPVVPSVKSLHWIDWDKETEQPDIGLTYGGMEIEPGEIVSFTPTQSSTAGTSTTIHGYQSLRQPSCAQPMNIHKQTALSLPTTLVQNLGTPIPPSNLPGIGNHAMGMNNSSMYTSGFGSPFHSPPISLPFQPSPIPIRGAALLGSRLSLYRPPSLNHSVHPLPLRVGGGNQHGADLKRTRESELSEDAESSGMINQRNSHSFIGYGSSNKRLRPL